MGVAKRYQSDIWDGNTISNLNIVKYLVDAHPTLELWKAIASSWYLPPIHLHSLKQQQDHNCTIYAREWRERVISEMYFGVLAGLTVRLQDVENRSVINACWVAAVGGRWRRGGRVATLAPDSVRATEETDSSCRLKDLTTDIYKSINHTSGLTKVKVFGKVLHVLSKNFQKTQQNNDKNIRYLRTSFRKA